MSIVPLPITRDQLGWGLPVPQEYANLMGGFQEGQALPQSFFDAFQLPNDPLTVGKRMAVANGNGNLLTSPAPGAVGPYTYNPNPAPAARPVNPAIQKALQGAYDSAGRLLASGGSSDGTQSAQTFRNANVGARTPGLYKATDAATSTANQNLADFTNELLKARPGQQNDLAQERGSINRVYATGPGSLRSELDQSRQNRSAAIRDATQSAIGQATRRNNLARMNSGNSSYLDRALGQDYARIASAAAGQDADLQRQNALELADRQAGLAGRRSNLTTNYLNTLTAPARQAFDFANLGTNATGNVAGLENANSIYDVTTPEQRIQRQLRLIDLMNGLDSRLNPATSASGGFDPMTGAPVSGVTNFTPSPIDFSQIPGLVGVPGYAGGGSVWNDQWTGPDLGGQAYQDAGMVPQGGW